MPGSGDVWVCASEKCNDLHITKCWAMFLFFHCRLSFYSGHASFSMYCMLFLAVSTWTSYIFIGILYHSVFTGTLRSKADCRTGHSGHSSKLLNTYQIIVNCKYVCFFKSIVAMLIGFSVNVIMVVTISDFHNNYRGESEKNKKKIKTLSVKLFF